MSAYFSATETSFSSINKFQSKNSEINGNNRAQLVLTISHEYDKLLSTILIFSEILPKSLEKESPKTWAMIAAPLLFFPYYVNPTNFFTG